MGANSAIEWTDHTFNAWVGCTRLSPACDFCYAESWAKRTGHPELWQGARRRTSAANWREPIKWNKRAEAAGKPARVFCCSLADVFDNQAEPQWRADLFDLIRATPRLEWQLLTKRPMNIMKMCAAAGGLPCNAALGTTTENQNEADLRIPYLIEAAEKLDPLYTFISAEPLLGAIDLTVDTEIGPLSWLKRHNIMNDKPTARIDWVICGGESGGKARPMHPDSARSLRDQCKAAGVPFFFKQWGEWRPPGPTCEYDTSGRVPGLPRALIVADDGTVHHFGETAGVNPKSMLRVGKKAAGRLLDGIEHNGLPQVRA